MIKGANEYMEIKPKVNLSLIGEIIFNFYAGNTGALILQKRYPRDVDNVNGKLYLGFTQEDTVKLYDDSGNGEIELETQVNFSDNASADMLPKRRIKVRRTRNVEIVAGNKPRYDMPDTVVDIDTGNEILIRGEKGDTAEFRYAFEKIEWKYTHEGESGWRELINMAIVSDAVTRSEAAQAASEKAASDAETSAIGADASATSAANAAFAAVDSANKAEDSKKSVNELYLSIRQFGQNARIDANAAKAAAETATSAANAASASAANAGNYATDALNSKNAAEAAAQNVIRLANEITQTKAEIIEEVLAALPRAEEVGF